MDFFADTLLGQGGPLIWPLLFIGLFGSFIVVERTFFLHKTQIRTNDFLEGIKNSLRKRRLVEAVTVCEETPGPVPRIIKAALLSYGENADQVRAAVQSAAIVEIPTLERRVGSIAALGKIAPLIGLIGTVVGLYKTLTGIDAEGGYTTQGVVSGGFAEALICTIVGLVIAAMAALTHHFLSGRVRALVHDMEFAGHEIIRFLTHELDKAQDTEEITKDDTSSS